MPDVSAIVKAYDVRGVVPDQLNPEVARLFGASFAELVGGPAVVIALRHAAVLAPSWPPRSPRVSPAQGVDVGPHGPRLHRPALLRQRHARPARRHVHGVAQPRASTTASSSAARAPRPWARTPDSASCVTASTPAARRPRRQPAPSPSATSSATTPTYLARPGRPVGRSGRSRSSSTPATAWAGSPSPPSSPGLPLDVIPMYFELDGTFPNHEANPHRPGQPGRPAEGGPRRTAPTSGWRSTATRTAASSSTSAASIVSPSRDHRPGRRPRAAPRAGRDRHPQPHHAHARSPRSIRRARRHAGPHPRRPLVHQGGDGADRTRSSAASTPATSTSATSGVPTPACWPRCTCSPRWAAQDGPLSALLAPYDRYVASGEINSRVADVAAATAAVEGGVRAAATVSRSTTSTG